jgi:hypothetical protein
MDADRRPRAPFLGWPRQWFHDDYGFGWIADARDGAVVTQSVHDRATIVGINALHDFLDRVIDSGFLRARPGSVVIHDWRSIRAIDPGVREAWSARSRRRGRHLDGLGAAYVVTSANGVVRMMIQTAALALQLATGQPPTRVVADPAAALAAHGIRGPSRAEYERL